MACLRILSAISSESSLCLQLPERSLCDISKMLDTTDTDWEIFQVSICDFCEMEFCAPCGDDFFGSVANLK